MLLSLVVGVAFWSRFALQSLLKLMIKYSSLLKLPMENLESRRKINIEELSRLTDLLKKLLILNKIVLMYGVEKKVIIKTAAPTFYLTFRCNYYSIPIIL